MTALIDKLPEALGDDFTMDELIERLDKRGAELNASAVTPNGQLMLKAAFYLKRAQIALRPFAIHADCYEGHRDEDGFSATIARNVLTVGKLRNARKALPR